MSNHVRAASSHNTHSALHSSKMNSDNNVYKAKKKGTKNGVVICSKLYYNDRVNVDISCTSLSCRGCEPCFALFCCCCCLVCMRLLTTTSTTAIKITPPVTAPPIIIPVFALLSLS